MKMWDWSLDAGGHAKTILINLTNVFDWITSIS